MSIGDWFKRLLSPARTDAPDDVAVQTDEETSIDEARLAAGGGGIVPSLARAETSEVVEEELSEYEAPPDPGA